MKPLKYILSGIPLIILIFLVSFKTEFSGENVKSDKKKSKTKIEKSCCSEKKEDGKCMGKANCTACSNCSKCAYCNSGGSCGVCSYKTKTYTAPKTYNSGSNSNGTSSGSNSTNGNTYSGSTPTSPASGTSGVYKVTASELFLRECASTTCKKLMTLHQNDKVVMMEIYDASWMKVKVELIDGTSMSGYVYRSYIIEE